MMQHYKHYIGLNPEIVSFVVISIIVADLGLACIGMKSEVTLTPVRGHKWIDAVGRIACILLLPCQLLLVRYEFNLTAMCSSLFVGNLINSRRTLVTLVVSKAALFLTFLRYFKRYFTEHMHPIFLSRCLNLHLHFCRYMV